MLECVLLVLGSYQIALLWNTKVLVLASNDLEHLSLVLSWNLCSQGCASGRKHDWCLKELQSALPDFWTLCLGCREINLPNRSHAEQCTTVDNRSYANFSINGWKGQVVLLVKVKNTMESQTLLRKESDAIRLSLRTWDCYCFPCWLCSEELNLQK